MADFERFLEELQTALNHLYDPAYRPSAQLDALLGGSTRPWTEVLVAAIDALTPPPATPPQARSRRLHQVLVYRYLEQLTQETTAERLHITARHVRREQNDAVHALAQALWSQRTQPVETAPDAPASAWSEQFRQEMTALQRRTPTGATDLSAIIPGVVDLLAPVLHNTALTLRLGDVRDGLIVTGQPAGVRQLLVRSITEWSRQNSHGDLVIGAQRAGNDVTIRLAGAPVQLDHLAADPLLQELLAEYGGSLRLMHNSTETTLTITLPIAPPVRVLVVDDNEDLLHFYRRYVQQTRYQITALSDGTRLLEMVEAIQPDVVILDVMLPKSDGWELLTTLRQHPLGQDLPILICSVIQEEALALALGANGYIPKPVRRSSLLQALDAATGQRDAIAPE